MNVFFKFKLQRLYVYDCDRVFAYTMCMD